MPFKINLFVILSLAFFLLSCSDERSNTTLSNTPEIPEIQKVQAVHVSIVLHFEENFIQSAPYFLRKRAELLTLATFLYDNDIKLNLQPDWAFMQAINDFENDKMRLSTDNKNILRYLSENLNHEIDPHAHEHGYNYADVAYMIQDLGVTPSTIVGGLIVDPVEDSKYNYLLAPISAQHFDYVWQAKWLWGGGTSGHVNDTYAAGVWRPKSANAFYENDDNAPIACIGRYINTVEGLYELIEKAQNGETQEGRMLTASIFIGQGKMVEMQEQLSTELATMRTYEANEQLKFASLSQVTQIWLNQYEGKGYLFIQP